MNNSVSLTPIVLFCMIFWLEGLFPHLVRQMNRIQHAVPNVLIAFIAAGINFIVIVLLTQKAMAWHETHAFGVLNQIDSSGIFIIMLAVVLFDLWMYIWHRLNHQVHFLWLLHRAHHNDIGMDVTTALRFHPIEIVISSLFNIGVVVLLGMDMVQFLVYNVVLQAVILFHHSNVGLPEDVDRLLRAIVVTPNMHRVHHSIDSVETNSNYSSMFSLWDRIFGTFRKRTDTRTIIYGLTYFREDVWQGLRGFLLLPFQRNVRVNQQDRC